MPNYTADAAINRHVDMFRIAPNLVVGPEALPTSPYFRGQRIVQSLPLDLATHTQVVRSVPFTTFSWRKADGILVGSENVLDKLERVYGLHYRGYGIAPTWIRVPYNRYMQYRRAVTESLGYTTENAGGSYVAGHRLLYRGADVSLNWPDERFDVMQCSNYAGMNACSRVIVSTPRDKPEPKMPVRLKEEAQRGIHPRDLHDGQLAVVVSQCVFYGTVVQCYGSELIVIGEPKSSAWANRSALTFKVRPLDTGSSIEIKE